MYFFFKKKKIHWTEKRSNTLSFAKSNRTSHTYHSHFKPWLYFFHLEKNNRIVLNGEAAKYELKEKKKAIAHHLMYVFFLNKKKDTLNGEAFKYFSPSLLTSNRTSHTYYPMILLWLLSTIKKNQVALYGEAVKYELKRKKKQSHIVQCL